MSVGLLPNLGSPKPLARRIRAAGHTVATFAAEAGVSPRTVAKYLRGQPVQIKQEFRILRTAADLPNRLPKGIEDIVGDFPGRTEAMPFERRIA